MPLLGELKVHEGHAQNNEFTSLVSVPQILISFLFLFTLATKS